MTEPATRSSWELLPEPEQKKWFEFSVIFTKAEADKLRRGHIPSVTEDRWFVFFENDWLIFCSSWSGAPIYGLHVLSTEQGMVSDRYWVSRDPSHAVQSDDVERAALIDAIAFLLECNEGYGLLW